MELSLRPRINCLMDIFLKLRRVASMTAHLGRLVCLSVKNIKMALTEKFNIELETKDVSRLSGP